MCLPPNAPDWLLPARPGEGICTSTWAGACPPVALAWLLPDYLGERILRKHKSLLPPWGGLCAGTQTTPGMGFCAGTRACACPLMRRTGYCLPTLGEGFTQKSSGKKRRVVSSGKKEEFVNHFFFLPLICLPKMELLPQEQMKDI